MSDINRRAYADMYGPTTGDRVRLGDSDLSRLEGIREAGSLISALGPDRCPLCGATPEDQHLNKECDGNIEEIISAAGTETKKIQNLKSELADTVAKLHEENKRYETSQPSLIESLEAIDKAIREISPSLSDKRAKYSELIEKRNEVQNALNLIKSIGELEERRKAIDDIVEGQPNSGNTITDLSASILNDFSILLEGILQAWTFPDSERVHFAKESNDIVISGKPRGSRGKGMRSITHTAFTLGLMKFTEEQNLPHPGFTVIDTPLLAYREPEGEEDDLSGTAVQEKFYEYLSGWESRQVIILENVDPPDFVKNNDQTTFFSKNPDLGRYGFLPYIERAVEN